jgi:hypothetical protein
MDGMKAVIYGFTALIIGLQSFYWIMSALYGGRINPWYAAPVFGSALLLVAAITLGFRKHLAAQIGLAGSLLSWIAYGTFAAASLASPHSTWHQLRFYISFHDYVPVLGAVLAPALLMACTAISIILFKKHPAISRILS